MRVRPTSLVLCAALVATLAYAQGTDTSVLKLPQDIEFKGPLTGPPQTAVLYGDPTKAGVFVTRVRFSAGWKDPPHWHPDEVRTVAVLSGSSTSAVATNGMRASSKPIRLAHSTPSLQGLRTSHGRRTVR